MARAGGGLVRALSALRDGRDTSEEIGVDLSSLNGQDTDVAIQTIVEALTPANGDADRVRTAMTEALSECLEGLAEFNFEHITDELLVNVMLAYVRNCIFQQIMLDSRNAFAKAATPDQARQAERDLRELISAATDVHMRPLLSGNLPGFTAQQLQGIQIQAIREIWAVWEEYGP